MNRASARLRLGRWLRGAVLELAAGEVALGEAGVVAGVGDGELGPGPVDLVGHRRGHHRPDALDLLQPGHAIGLGPLAAAVEDLGGDDHEVVLADGRDHLRIGRVGVLGLRLEPPRRVAGAGGVGPAPAPAAAFGDQRIGVVLEGATADVLVGEIAADEALLALGAGDAADAGQGRQVEEAIVVAARALPDQEAGAGDVVRVGEADQDAIAGGALAAQAVHAQRALARPPLPIEQPHLHRQPRIATGVALVDLARDPVSAARRRRCGAGAAASPYETPPSLAAPKRRGRRGEEKKGGSRTRLAEEDLRGRR